MLWAAERSMCAAFAVWEGKAREQRVHQWALLMLMEAWSFRASLEEKVRSQWEQYGSILIGV